MSDIEIYYFSGTGNSLVIARSLAETLDAKLTPLVPFLKHGEVKTDATVVGLVFPIYDFKVPPIVEAFVQKISTLDSKYVFAVATSGFLAQKALKKFDKTLLSCGGKLSFGFIVHMPNNGVVTDQMTPKKQKEIEQQWNAKLQKIAELVKNQQQGRIEATNFFSDFIFNGLFVRTLPKLLGLMSHVAVHGWSSLAFVSDENCNGCGTCTKVCPMDNITLVEGRPSWGKDCALCFACLQWCPKQAIQAGTFTVNKKRYHHPDVKISDIISQKQVPT
jgi:ferredoxin